MRVTVFTLILLGVAAFAPVTFANPLTVDIYAYVPGCGDTLVQSPEECDGTNFSGSSCVSLGFDSGSLSCSSVCTFVTSACVAGEDTSGGTRIEGRTHDAVPDTNIVVSGFAPPGMLLVLLKDGQRVGGAFAKLNGEFQITVSGIGSGKYKMQIIGTDNEGRIARSETISVTVTDSATTKVSGLTLPPTMSVRTYDGQVIVSGRTTLGSALELFVNGTKVASASSGLDGSYEFKLKNVKQGAVILLSVMRGDSATFSARVYESETLPDAVPGKCEIIADINNDCKVDVVDFFVTKARYLLEQFSGRFDYNKDGELTLTDFSIMAYYWTG